MTKTLAVVAGYVAVSLLWILGGGRALSLLATDFAFVAWLEIAKDALFAAASTLFIGWLVYRGHRLPQPGEAESAPERGQALISPTAGGAGAFLVAACVGAAVVWNASEGRVASRRESAALTAATQATRVKEQLDRSMSAAYSLAALVRQGHGEIEDFDHVASEMLPLFPAVSALQLAPAGVIRQIVPLAGHEKALGHDLFADPARNKEARLALETRRMTLAGPFDLLQGGAGVIGRLPVFLDESGGAARAFWGFVTVVVMMDDLVGASAIHDLARAGYRYELSRVHPDTRARQVFSGTAAAGLVDPLETRIEVPNGHWTLGIEPSQGWWSGRALAVELALALLGALAAGLAAYQVARLPERLHARVLQRTSDIEAARLQLEQSEARFRDLSEATSDWIWEVDAQGVFTYASPKVRELIGYEPEELIGRTAFDLMPAAEAERVRAQFRACAAKALPFALVDSVSRHKSGREVALEASGVPLFDPQGKLRGYRGISRDVTARRKAEEQARTLSLAVEQSADGIAIASAEGAIKFVNPKFCEMVRVGPSEVVGRSLFALESGWQQPEIRARMREAIDAGEPWFGQFHHQGADGASVWGVCSVFAIRDERGQVSSLVAVIEDISGRKQLESTLAQITYHDPLTGMPNRRLIRDRIGRAMAAAMLQGNSVALLVLDIDRLKYVNDSLGLAAGDELIKEVAKRLCVNLRENDSAARLEGDEFAMLITGVSGAEEVARVAERLRTALNCAYRIRDRELHVTASIGISVFPDDAADLDTLERNADTALHRAKRIGDGFRFFKPKMNLTVSRFLETENKLRRALERSEFSLHYQPQVDLACGRIVGAEALIRWRDPESGLVPPGRFIGLAEETGLIVPISDWVLREAARQAVAWRAAGTPCRVAVNLSPLQFRDGHVLESVAGALAQTGATADLLELEITESLAMGRTEENLGALRKLAEMGFKIAVDDFGTGYSSLAYLKHMPVHKLKIDGAFVRDMAGSPHDRAIVSAVVTLGHSLGMTVLAECVETRQQLDLLKAMRCDAIQGYLYSAPLPAEAFSAMLRAPRLAAVARGAGFRPCKDGGGSR